MSKTETQSEALRLADCLERDIRLEWMEIDHNTAAAAELRRLDAENKQLNVALDEWMEKTHWVQDTAQVLELGMHRADVLRARIEALDAENKALRERLEIDPSQPIDGIAARDETIRLLDAQILALRADAERYRWLRDLPEGSEHEQIGNFPGDMWDESIDAARGEDGNELLEVSVAVPMEDFTVQWWLARLDQYGNPKLVDGAHSQRAGADQAAYLIAAMNLGPGEKYAVARVELTEPRPSADGVNQKAIALHNRAAQAAAKNGGAA